MDDPGVLGRKLDQLGRQAPMPGGRGPPTQAFDWSQNAVITLA